MQMYGSQSLGMCVLVNTIGHVAPFINFFSHLRHVYEHVTTITPHICRMRADSTQKKTSSLIKGLLRASMKFNETSFLFLLSNDLKGITNFW